MSNPVRIRVRCTERVREKWEETRGKFDLTHAELALALCQFVLSREEEFRQHLDGQRDRDESGRSR